MVKSLVILGVFVLALYLAFSIGFDAQGVGAEFITWLVGIIQGCM